MNILAQSGSLDVVEPSAREWGHIVARYARPQNRRAATEVALTFIPFVLLWALTAFVVGQGYWIGMILTVPAAGLLLRLFIIQHDCGHGALFGNKTANNWVGRFAGVFTFTPYFFWNHAHKLHHMGSGSLSRRGIGDIKTMTKAEYEAASPFARFKYRLYRNPFVLFALGPAYIFLFDQRLPFGQMKDGWKPWISTMGTNISILAVSLLLMWLIGWKLFLIVQIPIVVLAATAGVWLFYVQHQFEETVWDDDANWTFHEAALYGSSHYDLPQPLRWFSGNIGLHHIHHLSSRIPFYRLPELVRDYPQLREINRMTISESIACVKLALWDEENRIMVPIKAAAV